MVRSLDTQKKTKKNVKSVNLAPVKLDSEEAWIDIDDNIASCLESLDAMKIEIMRDSLNEEKMKLQTLQEKNKEELKNLQALNMQFASFKKENEESKKLIDGIFAKLQKDLGDETKKDSKKKTKAKAKSRAAFGMSRIKKKGIVKKSLRSHRF